MTHVVILWELHMATFKRASVLWHQETKAGRTTPEGLELIALLRGVGGEAVLYEYIRIPMMG